MPIVFVTGIYNTCAVPTTQLYSRTPSKHLQHGIFWHIFVILQFVRHIWSNVWGRHRCVSLVYLRNIYLFIYYIWWISNIVSFFVFYNRPTNHQFFSSFRAICHRSVWLNFAKIICNLTSRSYFGDL